MNRPLVSTERFERAYRRLNSLDQQIVDGAVFRLARYLETRQASVGLGVKKLGTGIFEVRVGLSLRIVYIKEGPKVFLALLGNHDEVRRFLSRQ